MRGPLRRWIARLVHLDRPEDREVVFPVLLGVWAVVWAAVMVLRAMHGIAAGEDREGLHVGPWIFELAEGIVTVTLAWLLFLSIWAWSLRRGLTRIALVLAALVSASALVHLLALPAESTLEFTVLPLLPLTFLACYVLMASLLRAEHASTATLCGAVLCYLLLGTAFAQLLVGAWLLDPGQALVGFPPQPAGQPLLEYAVQQDILSRIQYFSFVTLTTLGYGDIHPGNSVTRQLAVVEALLGQIYIAIVVAKLVSLYLLSPESRSGGGVRRGS